MTVNLTRHNGGMNNNPTTTRELGMYTQEGNIALAHALLDALNLPAHEFPTGDYVEWFREWVKNHEVHNGTLTEHSEWTDTEVREFIDWVLENPSKAMKWLTS